MFLSQFKNGYLVQSVGILGAWDCVSTVMALDKICIICETIVIARCVEA